MSSNNPDQGKIQLDIQKIIVQLKLDQNNFPSYNNAVPHSALHIPTNNAPIRQSP